MANAKSYDELRSANLEENRRMLEELGVRMPRSGEKVMLNKPKLPPKQRKQRLPENPPKPNPDEDNAENKPDELGRSASRSFRVRLRPKNYHEEEEECIFDPPKPKIREPRPLPSYGKIPHVEVGREWKTRMECSEDLIHRPTVAGIHGGPDGAYSVALSGGYEDDVDFGESFTYTGEGGRDLKGTKDKPKNLRTAPQSKDQCLDRGNLALARSVETQIPVRVVRGYKLDSQYAPEEGYRYDGLYIVKKFWAAVGKSGFKVWKFAFIRCDTEPAPWVQMLLGNLGSPTSPTTPASIPQTGVEACEAPSFDADDCEDYSQLEEAQIGAKQPDDRKRVKKKVSFNSENSVKFFETESFEEEEPEEPSRVTTRSSSAKVVKNDGDDDIRPAQLRKRSQRTVKPTTKVRENYSLEYDVAPPKLAVSTLPVVLIAEMSLSSVPSLGEAFKKIKSSKSDESPKKVDLPKKKSLRERNENDKSPKKSPILSKSPKMEKCSPVAYDLKSKGKNTLEDKSGRQLVSPKERFDKSPQILTLKESPKSALREKSRKKSLSPYVREKLKSPKTSTDEVPRKRSISPDYPPPHEKPNSSKSSADEAPRKRSISPDYPVMHEKPRSSKSSSDEIPQKRSISPEFLPEDESRKKKSLERPSELSVSPPHSPANEKTENRSRRKPRMYPLSPTSTPADEKQDKRSRARARLHPLSPLSTPADEEQEKGSRGRHRQLSASPGGFPAGENTKKSPKSLLDDNRPKRSPVDKKLKKSPKSSPDVKCRERPLSPEYIPDDAEGMRVKGKTNKRSVSPEYHREKSPCGSPPKKSPKSGDSPPKEASKKQSVSPEHRSKYLHKQFKPSRSSLEEKSQKNSKSPAYNACKRSPKSAEVGPKQKKFKNSSSGSADLVCSLRTGKTLMQSPSPKKHTALSKHSPGISKHSKSPKSSEVLKNKTASVKKFVESNSPENSEENSRKSSGKKKQSPEEKTKQLSSILAGSIESRSRKRSLSPSDEGYQGYPSLKKQPRVSSPKSPSRTPTNFFKTREEENDEVGEGKISGNELSSEYVDDRPMSLESTEDETPTGCESEDPPNLTLAAEPETKKLGEEVPVELTPPETEIFNSNSSSPIPTPPETEISNSNGSSPTPTPPETEISNSNGSSPTPTPPSSVSSPTISASGSRPSVLVKANGTTHDILDNDEFPSDEEILNMMQFSLGACTSDGPRIVVKMVNGKWIELEENNTTTEKSAPR